MPYILFSRKEIRTSIIFRGKDEFIQALSHIGYNIGRSRLKKFEVTWEWATDLSHFSIYCYIEKTKSRLHDRKTEHFQSVDE